MHQTTPIRVPRTSGLRRIDSGLGRNCYGPFRSPRLFPRTELPDDSSEESLKADIQKLKEKQDMLDNEISQLVKEGYCVIELEDHIALLHEYNDIKDASMTSSTDASGKAGSDLRCHDQGVISRF